MPHDKLKVGVICQTLVQQHHFRQIIESCDLTLGKSILIDQVLKQPESVDNLTNSFDIWLIDIDVNKQEEEDNWPRFEEWVLALDKPLIFGEGNTFDAGSERFAAWCRQLKTKLITISGLLHVIEGQEKARHLWVLAASAGGPEAVKAFLDNMPTGLGIGFLYVQHIEERQHQPLVDIITRDSDYTSQLATHGDIIAADTVTLIPVSEEIKILPSHMVVSRFGQPWRGDYQPSIDQVVANIAMVGETQSGVIFFSGMGEDGVDGARLMARQGGQVWIQSLNSCASDAMPKAIDQTGVVNSTGTPKQLAKFLVTALTSDSNNT